MTHRRRSALEKSIQRDIEADLGAEPDLLLLRNSVGEAVYVKEDGLTEWHVPYGLGKGSPDLVGILRRSHRGAIGVGGKFVGYTRHERPDLGLWFCLEVKCPGEDATDEQSKVHAIWRSFGAVVEVVHSVEEARAALERARRLVT